MIALPEQWKWLLQPLKPATRARLEVCLGVVVTTAAIVGLSTVIRPDPSKLASQLVLSPLQSRSERVAPADLRPEPPAKPMVSPELAYAVARGDLEAMDKLFVTGMPFDGMLALAADANEKKAIVWLLAHGADVHEDEASVDAPLLAADAHPEIVALLLERGAKEPPLAQAAEAHAMNAVVRALAAHADVNPSDASPLAAAVSSTRGSNETRMLVVERLLDAGADPNREVGTLPLYAAVQACEERHEENEASYDCVPLVKLVLKHRARTTGDALGAALSYDEARRHALLDALLAAPIEPGATANALASASYLAPRDVKRIAAKGVDWAWHDGEDDAALPLISAVQRGDRDGVRTLLDVGAPADARAKDGTCALGVAIDANAGGGSPSHARIVEVLLAHGVDVNRRLPDGRTPLFAAAEAGDLRVLDALLERGARVNDLVLDDTALDAAEQHDHLSAERVLHARGARRARDR